MHVNKTPEIDGGATLVFPAGTGAPYPLTSLLGFVSRVLKQVLNYKVRLKE
jgi:hypothetical protein